MKNFLFTVIAIIFSFSITWAQDISVGKESIAKVDRPVLKAEYAIPSDIIEDALEDKLQSNQISKGSKVKGGFRVNKGVSIPEISDDKIDLYTRVDGRKDKSTMYIAVSRGYDNFVSAETDPEMMEKIKLYIRSMMDNVNIAKLKVDIIEQVKVTNSLDKEKESVEKDGSKLVSEQRNLEEKLADNKKEQEKNKQELAQAARKLQEQEAVLSELKAKLEMMVK